MNKLLKALPLLALILSIIACGSSNTGTKVGEATTVPSATEILPAAAETQPVDNSAQPGKPGVFNIGDVIEGEGFRITLLGAAYNAGTLKTKFFVENTGQEEISVSSIVSFEAKSDDGVKLEQDYMCGSSLDGSVLAGDRLKGDICWKLAAPTRLKVYYKDNVWASGAIVWQLDAAGLSAEIADAPIPAGENAADPAPIAGQVHTIGEVVIVAGYQVTLTGAAFNNGVLMANFLVENPSQEEISVSSLVSFEAKDASGTKLEQEYTCGRSMDGPVLAGDRLKGDICWKIPTPGKVRLYYTDNIWTGGAMVWELDTAALPASITETAPAQPPAITIQTYKVGDIVEMQGHRITLVSAENTNGVLKTNFLIENIGNEEITASSLISFFARNPQGTKLEQEYMCGASMDGSILPGDKLKGDICWKTGGASPILIYYRANVWENGAVVWSIQ